MLKKYVDILTDQDPHLRMKSENVPFPLAKKDMDILKKLLAYVVDSHDEKLREKYGLLAASGLAAPQIGINRALIAVCLEDEDKNGEPVVYQIALANPRIISHSEQDAYLKGGEGCLSVKDEHEGYVKRHARITVEGIDYFTNQKVMLRAKGYLAIVLQHEIDHLSGILFYDHIDKRNPYRPIPGAIVIE